jgi:hypothetical protein
LELGTKDNFGYDSGDGYNVAYKLIHGRDNVPVFFYKPFNPWSAAMGYSDGKAIYINSRKFASFAREDLIGLLLHEYSHIAGFSHGNNYKTEEKCLFSVPYFISENVKRWL